MALFALGLKAEMTLFYDDQKNERSSIRQVVATANIEGLATTTVLKMLDRQHYIAQKRHKYAYNHLMPYT
jgi:hypothetical protein